MSVRSLPPFAKTPVSVVRDPTLSVNARLLWTLLDSYADKDGSNAHPSVQRLAAEMGVSDSTIHRARRELVQRKLLKVVPRVALQGDADTNDYHLQWGIEESQVIPGGPTHEPTPGVTHDTQLITNLPKEGILPLEIDTAPTSYESQFDSLWQIYPRKDSRKQALNACLARFREGIRFDDLLIATENYALSVKRNGTQRQFVMRGATFFGPNERWRDYSAGPVYDEGTRASPSTGSRSYEEPEWVRDFRAKYPDRR